LNTTQNTNIAWPNAWLLARSRSLAACSASCCLCR
jgi:hypothetical protein